MQVQELTKKIHDDFPKTWILDRDLYKSASYLDRNRLQINIQISIQLLASLLDCTDKLVNPKKNVKHYPQAQLWVGYERQLLYYIHCHLCEWNNRNFKSIINIKNYDILYTQTLKNKGILDAEDCKHLPWITEELIQTHRTVLIQKEIEKNIKIIKKYPDYQGISDKEEFEKMKKRLSHHYRNLWPDCWEHIVNNYEE